MHEHRFVMLYDVQIYEIVSSQRTYSHVIHNHTAMATQIVDVEWTHDLTFDAHQQGRTLKLMSSPHEDSEEKAVSPKLLLLTGLAGCTAMDVASLLPKMRVPFSLLRVFVEGQLSEEHPKTYVKIHMVYELCCDPDHADAVERAINLSKSTYCGVYAMLSKVSDISHEVRIVA
jgi:putative redox protein